MTGRRPRRGRRAPVVVALLSVVAVHAWLLWTWPHAAAPEHAGVVVRSLLTRQVAPPEAELPERDPTAAAVAAPPMPAVAPTRPVPRAARRRPSTAEAPRPAPVATDLARVSDPWAVAASASSSATGVDVPVYVTRLPPSGRWAYDWRRDAALGDATLLWSLDDGRYVIEWQQAAFGQPVLTTRSQGRIDAHGVAPERYTERRGRRAELAVNFRRDAGIVSFSGPSVQQPLMTGAQDRLSWMIQLAAVVEADPALRAPGAQVVLHVTGVRAEADPWRFDVLERGSRPRPAGVPDGALVLRRMPQRAFDTEVEVWLDPARHHLPAYVRLFVPETGDGHSFVLRPP